MNQKRKPLKRDFNLFVFGDIMELSPRLKKIAELVPKGTKALADIGTDHAYLPAYCILNGICQSAFAMDVNEGPLKRAEETLAKYNVKDKITLRLSDGIEKLQNGEADVIVIAGMGGLLIKKILEEHKEVISKDTILILQPMIAQRELREYLFNCGFCVENEYVVSEGNKHYNIFSVKASENSDFDDRDIIIGRNLSKNSPECFIKYAEYKIRVLTKILKGMEKSTLEISTDEIKKELFMFEKELERGRCCEG